MNDHYITISVDAGEDGKASVAVHRDSQVGKLVDAFERLLLFLGYQQASIRRAFDDSGYYASNQHEPSEDL